MFPYWWLFWSWLSMKCRASQRWIVLRLPRFPPKFCHRTLFEKAALSLQCNRWQQLLPLLVWSFGARQPGASANSGHKFTQESEGLATRSSGNLVPIGTTVSCTIVRCRRAPRRLFWSSASSAFDCRGCLGFWVDQLGFQSYFLGLQIVRETYTFFGFDLDWKLPTKKVSEPRFGSDPRPLSVETASAGVSSAWAFLRPFGFCRWCSGHPESPTIRAGISSRLLPRHLSASPFHSESHWLYHWFHRRCWPEFRDGVHTHQYPCLWIFHHSRRISVHDYVFANRT